MATLNKISNILIINEDNLEYITVFKDTNKVEMKFVSGSAIEFLKESNEAAKLCLKSIEDELFEEEEGES